MRRMSAVAVAALAVCLAAGEMLCAQPPRGSVGVTTGVELNVPNSYNLPPPTGWLLGGSLVLWPSRHLGVGVDATETFVARQTFCGLCFAGGPPPQVATSDIFSMAVTARVRPAGERPLVPYLIVGVGFAAAPGRNAMGVESVLGGGVSVRLGNGWRLRPEYRASAQAHVNTIAGVNRFAVTLAHVF